MSAGVGATVNVFARNTDGTNGSASTVYTTPDLGTTATNPITADAAGRITGWLDQGSYNLVVSGTGITTYTQPFDAMPASNIVPGANTVGSSQLTSAAVTSGKIFTDAVTDGNRPVVTDSIRDGSVTTGKLAALAVDGTKLASGAVSTSAKLGAKIVAPSNLAITPTCRVTHNASQNTSGTANATTAIAFNTERWDTDTLHDTVTNNTRITVVTAGVYVLNFSGLITSAQDGDVMRIRLNGSTSIAGQGFVTYAPGGTTTTWNITMTAVYTLAATDYVEAIYVNSAGTGARAVTNTGNVSPEFSAVWSGNFS